MLRSQVNEILREGEQLLRRVGFALPPFAFWSLEDWHAVGKDSLGLVRRGLGWDITDFGSGRFSQTGLLLFTLRNAPLADSSDEEQASYAEKAMVIRTGQKTPMHFHWSKTEDIINRGGGVLAIQLYGSTDKEALGDQEISFTSDGHSYKVPAGHTMRLLPGSSITLPPKLYHSFRAEEQDVVAGEISTTNDDRTDNRFLDGLVRFPSITEDESPHRLLVSDYANFLPWIRLSDN